MKPTTSLTYPTLNDPCLNCLVRACCSQVCSNLRLYFLSVIKYLTHHPEDTAWLYEEFSSAQAQLIISISTLINDRPNMYEVKSILDSLSRDQLQLRRKKCQP